MSGREPKPDFLPAIARMQQMAAESADHLLLGDGPPHPDAELLDLCAEALRLLVAAERAKGSRREWKLDGDPAKVAAERAEDSRLYGILLENEKRARPPLVRIAKLKAATAAGVYAKALVVRASATGASMLAMTLADDLVNNPQLRACLWVAETREAPA